MGNADRIIRIMLAAIAGVLYFMHIINGTVAIVLIVLAGIFILTSLVGFCPVYAVFGINTCPHKKEPAK